MDQPRAKLWIVLSLWIVAFGVAVVAASRHPGPEPRDAVGLRAPVGARLSSLPSPPEPRAAVIAAPQVAAAGRSQAQVEAIASLTSPPVERRQSPLTRSPGYYPPDDPESTSVVTGRREAPWVDLELTGGASSKEDLARMVLATLQRKDENALHALRVTRREFETIFWREFPESRPITNITAQDAWTMSLTQSIAGASRASGVYGGHALELLRVETAPASTYKNFTLYRQTVIVARDNSSALEVRIKLMPSIAERHGRYKALLFKD